MPADTGDPHKIPYALIADSPADIEAATKPLAERVHERLNNIAPSQLVASEADAGKLLVVGNTGAPAFAAMKGDATLASDGTVTISSERVGTPKLTDKAVTTAKINDGAVTTAKINDGAVTTPKLTDKAVTTAKINDGAVSSRKVAPLAGSVMASAGKQLSTSYVDIPGTSIVISPEVSSKVLVTMTFEFSLYQAGSGVACSGMCWGRLVVDGNPIEEPQARFDVGHPMAGGQQLYRATVSQSLLAPLTAGSHTLKLQAKVDELGLSLALISVETLGQTGFTYMVVAA